MIDQDTYLALKGNYRYMSHRLEASLDIIAQAMAHEGRGRPKNPPESYTLSRQSLEDLQSLLEDLQHRLQIMFNPRQRPDLKKDKSV